MVFGENSPFLTDFYGAYEIVVVYIRVAEVRVEMWLGLNFHF